MGGAAAGAARRRAYGAIIGCGIRRHKAGQGRVGELRGGVLTAGGARSALTGVCWGVLGVYAGWAGVGRWVERVTIAVRGLA